MQIRKFLSGQLHHVASAVDLLHKWQVVVARTRSPA